MRRSVIEVNVMHANEQRLGWWTKLMISLGFPYDSEPELPEEDGTLLPFPTDTKAQIAVLTPTSMNAMKVPADFLIRGQAVLINFHSLDKKIADNARFFLSGVTYAIDGSIHKMTDTIYLFTPHEIGIIPYQTENKENRDISLESEKEHTSEFRKRILA